MSVEKKKLFFFLFLRGAVDGIQGHVHARLGLSPSNHIPNRGSRSQGLTVQPRLAIIPALSSGG